MKRRYVLLVLLAAIIYLSGCQTAAGTAKGLACGVENTAEGIGKDVYATGGFLESVDSWIKKNLW